MEFGTMMEQLADLAGGSFSQYDDTTSVLIVPVGEHRIQTVYAYDEGEQGIKIISKACDENDVTPYEKLVRNNGSLSYSCIGIEDGLIYVKSRVLPGAEPGKAMKDMLLEIAETADNWELKLTDQDIH